MILVLYLALLTLPGGAIYLVAGGVRHVFLYSYALSVGLLVLTQVLFRVQGGSLRIWYAVLGITWVVALGVALLVKIRQRRRNQSDARRKRNIPWSRRRTAYLLGFAATLLAAAAYLKYAGVYTEVPADFWFHLMRVNWEHGALAEGRLNRYGFGAEALLNRDYAHNLHALVALYSGKLPLDAAPEAMVATTLLFISGIYWFSIAVFREETKVAWRVATAVLAALLTAAWLGTGVFSFIRYYAYAPAMLNMILFFASAVLMIEAARKKKGRIAKLAFGVVLIVTMALVHVQEALFAAVIGFGICACRWLRVRMGAGRPLPVSAMGTTMRLLAIAVVLFASLIVVVLLYHAMLRVGDRSIVDLGAFAPVLQGAYVLHPLGRIYDVLTSFGVATYVATLLFWRNFANNDYIAAGMLSPLVTVFNPLFTAVYLRAEDLGTLWRLGYMVPVGMVAARIFVLVWQQWYRPGTSAQRWRAAVAASVLVAAVPVDGVRADARLIDRWVTLRPQNPESGAMWIKDLVDWMNTQARKLVITDPVTSYVLRSATRQPVHGFKFYQRTSGYDFRTLTENQGMDWLDDITQGYVVVNRRDGPPSEVGRRSGHWREYELRASEWYPDNFENALDERAERYKRVWQSGDVTVYKIVSARAERVREKPGQEKSAR